MPRLSPAGRWLAFMGRDAQGIMNLWLRDLQNPGSDKQITFYDDFDACTLFRFASEQFIIFLRQTEHGSEFYHLYRLDLATASPWKTVCDMINEPKTSCGLGFVGVYTEPTLQTASLILCRQCAIVGVWAVGLL